MSNTQPLRVGIGGPVGSGKTALTLALCKALRGHKREWERKLTEMGRDGREGLEKYRAELAAARSGRKKR